MKMFKLTAIFVTIVTIASSAFACNSWYERCGRDKEDNVESAETVMDKEQVTEESDITTSEEVVSSEEIEAELAAE